MIGITALAASLLRNPTAPFREAAVRGWLTRFLEARGIPFKVDSMGNILASYGKGHPSSRLAFCAHMDHPGFIVERDSKGGVTSAVFYGVVGREYFKGAKVRAFTTDGEIRGRVTSIHPDKPIRVQVRLAGEASRGDIIMWDLPSFERKGDLLSSRACDDVMGCLAVAVLLDTLKRRKVRKGVLAVFSVAEESGFHGCKHVCLRRGIPKSFRPISIECSRAVSGVPIGGGPIVRVGDSRSVFDPGMTRFMLAVAAGNKVQRKLMDGGACEATVFQEFGYAAGGLCLALGNYHNQDFMTGRIAPEYVSLADLKGLVELCAALVERSHEYGALSQTRRPGYCVRRCELGEAWNR